MELFEFEEEFRRMQAKIHLFLTVISLIHVFQDTTVIGIYVNINGKINTVYREKWGRKTEQQTNNLFL
jgi:hypothetical protein